MAKKPVVFLNKIYKTQTEFETYVKNIIYNIIGKCDDVKNKHPLQYDILIEILKRHPEYDSKTQNMCNIKITNDILNTNALKVLILNTDNTEMDISWKCAITGKPKGNKNDLMSAMRSCLDSQILEYKNTNKNECNFCKSNHKLQVDHILHFDVIAFNFINIMSCNNIPNTFIEKNDGTHRKTFIDDDIEFKNKWIEYHQNNATLRILCQSCNLKRSKSTIKYSTFQ